jgi:hypothetical protein
MLPFIEKIRADEPYVRTLRELWKSRTFNAKKLPKNAELLERLPSASTFELLNPLTGILSAEKHDAGML